MRIILTDEMKALRDKFEPYTIGCHLSENAPPEAVEAEKKFYDLFNKTFEEERAENFT